MILFLILFGFFVLMRGDQCILLFSRGQSGLLAFDGRLLQYLHFLLPSSNFLEHRSLIQKTSRTVAHISSSKTTLLLQLPSSNFNLIRPHLNHTLNWVIGFVLKYLLYWLFRKTSRECPLLKFMGLYDKRLLGMDLLCLR